MGENEKTKVSATNEFRREFSLSVRFILFLCHVKLNVKLI